MFASGVHALPSTPAKIEPKDLDGQTLHTHLLSHFPGLPRNQFLSLGETAWHELELSEKTSQMVLHV